MRKRELFKIKERVKEIVYSCLYKEFVEIGYLTNFEAGKISITLFDKKLAKYFKELYKKAES